MARPTQRPAAPCADAARAATPRTDSARAAALRIDSARTAALRTDSARAAAPRVDSSRAATPRVDSSRAATPRIDSARAGMPRTDADRTAARSADARSAARTDARKAAARTDARTAASRTDARSAASRTDARSDARSAASRADSARPAATRYRHGIPPRARPPRLLPVDARLAPPETRLEYLHGLELFAAPADPPHATLHATLAYVLYAHAAPGYITAVDMLTRTDEVSDFAPDASVYPEGDDPETGGRKLEELAFEVCVEQALSVPTKKARELIRRGVRRVFCLLVGRARLLEWSRPTDGWRPLSPEASIKDRCLSYPLPVRALLDATAGDVAVFSALRARRVPALMAALAEYRRKGETKGEARGEERGLRVAVTDLCEVFGITLGPKRRARLEAMGPAELEALRQALKRERRWPGAKGR